MSTFENFWVWQISELQVYVILLTSGIVTVKVALALNWKEEVYFRKEIYWSNYSVMSDN